MTDPGNEVERATFEPAQHLIVCRHRETGAHLYATLQEIAAADPGDIIGAVPQVSAALAVDAATVRALVDAAVAARPVPAADLSPVLSLLQDMAAEINALKLQSADREHRIMVLESIMREIPGLADDQQRGAA